MPHARRARKIGDAPEGALLAWSGVGLIMQDKQGRESFGTAVETKQRDDYDTR